MRTYRALAHRFSIQAPGGPLAHELHAALAPLADEAMRRPAVIYEVEAAGRLHPELWRLRSGETVLVAAGDRRSIAEQVGWEVNRSAIQSVVGSRIVLHAGVVHRDGVTVLLAGRSGSGKSTLTAGLTALGWQYVTDEAAAIDARTRAIDPYPKAISLTESSLDQIAALVSTEVRTCWRPVRAGKVQLDPLDIGHIARVPVPAPSVVVFPTWTEGQRSAIQEVQPVDAVVEACQHAFYPTISDQADLQALADLVMMASSRVRLQFGGLGEAVATIGDLAERVRR